MVKKLILAEVCHKEIFYAPIFDNKIVKINLIYIEFLIMRNLQTIEYTFEDFSNISICGGPIWHPTKNSLYFISNIDEVYQIYRTDILEGHSIWPTRLTFTKDRTTVPIISKTGMIYYLTDEGGNENWQINELDPVTKKTIPLTTISDRKHQKVLIDEGQLIFSANRDNKKRFDIYKYSLKSQKVDLLLESKVDGILSAESLTNNGLRLLLNENISINEKKFLVFDLHSKQLNKIPITEKGSWKNGLFLDNTHVLCLTDIDREFSSLAILNIESNTFQYLEESAWDTEYYIYDKDTGRIAWVKNEDGYSKLNCGYLQQFKIKNIYEIPLPEKSVINAGDSRSYLNPLAFNHDASLIALCMDSSSVNQNIWIATLSQNCVKHFWSATNVGTGKIDQSIFVSETLHKILSFDEIVFSSYLYLPKTSTSEKVPCVIMIHGGPEGQVRPDFNPLLQFFLYNGFAVASPNVRGSSGYGRTFNQLDNVELRLNSVKDIASLAKYLEKILEIDTKKLIVYGGSYGGYMVLACMTEFPELYSAGIDIVGISNFVTFLENTALWRRKLREVEYGSLEKDRAFLESISPIHKAKKISKPLLIVHGKNDERVPLSETLQMHDLLKSRSVPVELLIFEDEGHGVVKTKNKTIQYKKIIEFLNKFGR